MTIRGLATALKISSTPIREALHGLAAEGAIEILPNRLIRVPLLSTERLIERTHPACTAWTVCE